MLTDRNNMTTGDTASPQYDMNGVNQEIQTIFSLVEKKSNDELSVGVKTALATYLKTRNQIRNLLLNPDNVDHIVSDVQDIIFQISKSRN